MLVEGLQGDACTGARPVASQCLLPDGFHVLPWGKADQIGLIPAWDRLASRAVSPNPFFEPWYLLPSLEAFDPAGEVHLLVLVEGGELRALVPNWRDPSHQGRPLAHFAPWLHANMFCGVPLIVEGTERSFWQAYLAHLDVAPDQAWFLHLPLLPADCSVSRALGLLCKDQGRQLLEVHRVSRAMLQSGPSPEQHLAQAMSTKKRKELRRQRARLEEIGPLRVQRSRDRQGLDQWIDDFLALERRGWKGERGSAMASDPRSERVFRQALADAATRGRLKRLALYCSDKPIAMLATFLSPPGAFSYKTSFDEDFARFSPGMLLQLENLALLDDPDIAWCDSCAAADHPMIERIWRDRREIVWLSAGIGRGLRRKGGELWARLEARRAERRA